MKKSKINMVRLIITAVISSVYVFFVVFGLLQCKKEYIFPTTVIGGFTAYLGLFYPLLIPVCFFIFNNFTAFKTAVKIPVNILFAIIAGIGLIFS